LRHRPVSRADTPKHKAHPKAWIGIGHRGLCLKGTGGSYNFDSDQRRLRQRNEPSGKSRFDQIAGRSDAKRVYRTMMLVWALTLIAKSAVSVVSALICSTRQYLIPSPLFTYSSDVLLAWWSFHYGYSKLGHYANHPQAGANEIAVPGLENGT
jgi:hypothetical protein